MTRTRLSEELQSIRAWINTIDREVYLRRCVGDKISLRDWEIFRARLGIGRIGLPVKPLGIEEIARKWQFTMPRGWQIVRDVVREIKPYIEAIEAAKESTHG